MKNREERKLLYKATHKYLCPRCEGKSAKQLMIENMFAIPFLVKTKCSVCGYDGMLVEVPINSDVQIPRKDEQPRMTRVGGVTQPNGKDV